MAEQKTVITEAVTPEAFVADRQRFWNAFTQFTIGSVVAVVILLLLMRLFLL